MSKDYISIQDAAELSRKSIQTIRRAIKSKKLLVKRQKTPQGFNYLIEKSSLNSFYNLGLKIEQDSNAKTSEVNDNVEENIVTKKEVKSKKLSVEADEFKSFCRNLETLLSQHSEERQNFLRLINTLQEKVFVLENQLNLLKSPVQRKWYQLWK